MAKVQRKGSFESAGLKKTRLKSAKEEKVDLLFAGPLDDAILSVRTWLEECIGTKQNENLSFNELIDDGVILCELVQYIQPGLVRKISKVKSRFAYWENFTFFLKACKSLGLQDWQLFDPEDLLGQKAVPGKSPKFSERRVKNIVAILYWLALALEASPFFSGPKLDSRPFHNEFSSKCSDSPVSTTNHSSLSSIPNTTSPCPTPKHKLISVSTPCIEQQKLIGSPLSSPEHRNSSPLIWVGKIQEKESSTNSQDSYKFSQSDAALTDSCYRIPSQHSLLNNTDPSDPTGPSQSGYSRKRKETLSVRVEAYNPPSAFNADLVFVHGSTSSSVFSPTTENQVTESETPFSPNHLSNTFDATDPIDNTGLIIDPLEFHSEVFTAGTDSQESGPHFSSPRPDSTFHVNLTQSSQPDNLSISNTQLDDFGAVSSELPVISEVAPNNSSPIDTFDLHHTGGVPATNHPHPNVHSTIEYSHSQEYNEKQIHHIDTPNTTNTPITTPSPLSHSSTEQTPKKPYPSNNTKHRPGISSNNTSVNSGRLSRDTTALNTTSTSTATDSSPQTSSDSNTSLIVVSYSPRTSSGSSPFTRRTSSQLPVTEPSSEVKSLYRRYSSPQQRPGYKSIKSLGVHTAVEGTVVQSESGSEGETDNGNMALIHRTSGKKQMKIMPNILSSPSSLRGKEVGVALSNGLLTTDLHATFLPGERRHGIVLESVLRRHASSYPIVRSIEEDTPAHRCGVQPGDEVTKVNDVSLYGVSIEESNALLNKAITQKKLSLSIHRDTLSNGTKSYGHNTTVVTDGTIPVSTTAHYNGVPDNSSPQHRTLPPAVAVVTDKPSNYSRARSLSSGVDFKRVHSGALPKHQVVSTIYTIGNELTPGATTVGDDDATSGVDSNISTSDAKEDETMSNQRDYKAIEVDSHDLSIETSSRGSVSSITKEESYSEVIDNSVHYQSDLEGHVMEGSQSIHHRGSDGVIHHKTTGDTVLGHQYRTGSPLEYMKDDESFMSCGGPGKSQSVTELSTISPLPPLHTRDKSDTGVTNFFKSHSKAKKTESLPGKLRAQSLNFRDSSSSNRSSASTPGVGLGLTNMSMEDMHSASKLQIDQIWKEVESSSSLVSPNDEDHPQDRKQKLLLETINTQTPDEGSQSSYTGTSVTEQQDQDRHLTTVDQESTNREHEISNSRGNNQLPKRSSSKVNEKKGIESLLTTLRSLNEKVGTYEEEEEFKLLETILQSSKFRKAKELHDNMRSLVTEAPDAPHPVKRRALPSTHYVRHYFREDILRPMPETEELRRLLRKPDVQSVLFCHDKVATHDLYVPSTFFPRSAQDQEDIILTHSAVNLTATSLYTTEEAPLSRDIPCNRKENAAIVYLQRTNRPLGCAIYKDGDSVFVSKILDGCDAEQSGAIKEGDELLEVNGIALMGKTNDEIIRLMSGEAGKTVSFTLIPVHDDSGELGYEEKYVRAHFSYNGMMDEEIPCKELALNFSPGDILEISNQDDPDWWQARKVFEDGGESLPGLIPARHLQQKREVLKESHAVHNVLEEKSRRKSLLSKITRKTKKKKIYYNQGPFNGGFHSIGHEVATYEDVVKLLPDLNRRRPIILIGAPSVGRRTLINEMVRCYPKHYCTVISHTTRPQRIGEVDSKDYHFITRDNMERYIQEGRFLDYTESKGYLHGVAISSVKDVVDRGKIPVMDLTPQALKVIGSSGLIPYVVFIGAPRVDRLMMTRKMILEKKKKLQASLSADYLDRDVRSFTEGELIDLYRKSQDINTEYSHYFDSIVINDDLQIAFGYLLEVARRIEEEPQWVSSSWVEEV